jgi:hypothetical protein
MFHLDFFTTFLNSKFSHQVYMRQPRGFKVQSQESQVCLFNRALYGLKQSPNEWFKKIDKYLKKLFLKQSFFGGNLYYIKHGAKIVIIVLYVDNLFVTGNDLPKIQWLKTQLMTRFKMTDLGLITKYLGLQFTKTDEGLLLH